LKNYQDCRLLAVDEFASHAFAAIRSITDIIGTVGWCKLQVRHKFETRKDGRKWWDTPILLST